MLSLVSHLRTGSTFNRVHIASTVLLFTEYRRLFKSVLETRQSKGDSETLVSG